MTQRDENYFIRVTLTPEQARVVVTALDVLARIHIGQFHTIREQFFCQDIDVGKIEALMEEVKVSIFPDLTGGPSHSYGISSCPSERGKIAWDVLQAIRHCEAYARHPEGGITVDFNTPMFVSDSVPRPTAKQINILDKLAEI